MNKQNMAYSCNKNEPTADKIDASQKYYEWKKLDVEVLLWSFNCIDMEAFFSWVVWVYVCPTYFSI